MTVLTSPNTVAAQPSAARPLLTVTQGLHQGGRIRLDGTVYTVGSTAEADFILNDPGIAPRHLVLRLEGDRVAVEALGGDVRVDDGRGRSTLVPAGSGYRAELPLGLTLGEARLSVQPARPVPVQAAPQRLGRVQWLIALGLMGLCAVAFAMRDESPRSRVATAAAAMPATPVAPSPATALAWLQAEAHNAGLTSVAFSQAGGQLVASGHTDPSQQARWDALRQGFDARYGRHVMLKSTVLSRAEVARPRVHFQAVWFGAQPYVINEGGKRLYPGASVGDGWSLDRIEEDQVVLARGDERFTLTL